MEYDKGQDNKGYYAAQPPQYPQQVHPAYGQPAYGEAASYQPATYQTGYPQQDQQYGTPHPGYGYPASPSQNGYYPQPQAQSTPNPVVVQQHAPQQNKADDACMGCALGACLCCCLDAWC